MKARSILFIAITILMAIALSSPVYAECTSTSCIDYQGMLTDSTGKPVTGDKNIIFLIYGQESGGTDLWQETQTVTLDNNGLFNVLLGEETTGGLPASIFDWRDLWLEVEVAGETLGPRKQIVSLGYAMSVPNSGFSAYDDLVEEGKIGTGSDQVAAGNHTHESSCNCSLDCVNVQESGGPGVYALYAVCPEGYKVTGGGCLFANAEHHLDTSQFYDEFWSCIIQGHGNDPDTYVQTTKARCCRTICE